MSYTGVLPDLFSENEGMVGTGRYVNGVFEASEILAKHDETYMPKEVVDALKEQGVYQGTRRQLAPASSYPLPYERTPWSEYAHFCLRKSCLSHPV